MSKEKKNKKQGPIRTGVVLPLTLTIAGIVLFSTFLLDSAIEKAIEFVGEKINGAEVNVASVETSFKDLSVVVSKVEVTDKTNPDFNKFQIGSLKFQMLWDALLRAKVVIETAEVNNILLNTKRSYKGYVLPPPPPGDDKKTQEMLNKARKEFDGNVIGDLAGVLSGDSIGAGKKIEGELESKKRFEALKVEVNQKEAQLKQTFSKLPKKDDLNKLQNRIKGINWNDLGNLTKAPKLLKEVDTIQKDINKTIKAYDGAQKQLNQSVTDVSQSYKEAEALVQKDIDNIGKRMKLPSLDPASIAKMLFGNELLSKVEEAKKYHTMAKKYMPPKKEGKEAPLKRERGKGRDYRFGTPKSYPLFWLKRAKIDSQNEQGMVQGLITDVTNNQRQINKLTEINVEADFPVMQLRDIDSKIVLDFMQEPKANVNMSIGSYPVKDKALSDSEDAKFIIKTAKVRSDFKGVLKEERADFRLNNTFREIQYEVSAKSAGVNEVLQDVANNTQTLRLDAKARGRWDALKFEISSNLAKAIENSARSVVQAKIDKAKNKIKADVEAQIAGTKKEVNDKISKFKSEYTKQINTFKKKYKEITSKLSRDKKKAEKKVKKKAGNLLKGIKL